MTNEKGKELLYELLQEKTMLGEGAAGIRNGRSEVDMVSFFHVLRKKILILILAAVIGAGTMGAYSFFLATPMYQSTAKVYVLTQSTSITSFADIQISSALAADYQEMIFSYPVVKQVINNLGLDYKYKEVTEEMLSVDNPRDTRVIKVMIVSDDAEKSAAMANEFARVAKRTIADIMETDEPKIFEHGRVITEPVSPNKARNIAIGFIGGAFIAALVLLILFATRDTIRTPDDIERRLGGNVLATVPFEKGSKDKTKSKGKTRKGVKK